MATKRSKPAPRKPRADAQRNRERILEVAKQAFSRSGPNASLDDIAKEAKLDLELCIATFLHEMF
jgi:AcrR family transcriptional regulator